MIKQLGIIGVAAIIAPTLAAAEWRDLFNGKDVEGWIRRGGQADYTVEDGCLVGTSKLETPNTFLCPPRDYADFILEYEVKVDPRLNSGVQIRSQIFPEAISFEWRGKTIKVPANTVHGYQVELDPDPVKDRWWTGGIYDESARFWLYPGALGGDPKAFSDQGRAIFKQDGWNKIRVEAVGSSIKTFLNGKSRAVIEDSRVASGFIGFQVHWIGKETEKKGTQVRWRNIRIQELQPAGGPNTLTEAEKAEGWRLLWDGKTSNGWCGARSQEFPKTGWIIKDDSLTITETGGSESTAAGDIITREEFSDFELKADFKITSGANSGIKLFVDPLLNKGEGSSIGLEFQILDDARHPDAKLGRDGNRTIGSLYDLIPAPRDKKVMPVGEWNQARILSAGNRGTFWLNGEKTVEFERGTPEWRKLVGSSKYKIWPGFGELKKGRILLQDHGNEVSYRNIKIRDLSSK